MVHKITIMKGEIKNELFEIITRETLHQEIRDVLRVCILDT